VLLRRSTNPICNLSGCTIGEHMRRFWKMEGKSKGSIEDGRKKKELEIRKNKAKRQTFMCFNFFNFLLDELDTYDMHTLFS
jgi:hypothetical protein